MKHLVIAIDRFVSVVNLYGDIDMSIASDIGAIVGECENFLFGAAYTEEGTGHIGLVVIAGKEEI